MRRTRAVLTCCVVAVGVASVSTVPVVASLNRAQRRPSSGHFPLRIPEALILRIPSTRSLPNFDRIGPDGTWRGHVAGLGPSEMIDLHKIATNESMTAIEVLENKAREREFDRVVESFRQNHEGRFVAAQLTGSSATIHVTGSANDFGT